MASAPTTLKPKFSFHKDLKHKERRRELPFVTPLVSQSSPEGSERSETDPSQSLLSFLFRCKHCQKILEFMVASVKVLERVLVLEPNRHQTSDCKVFDHTSPDLDINSKFTREAKDFYVTLPVEYLIILEINYIECNSREQDLIFTFPRFKYFKYLNSSLKSGRSPPFL